MSELDNEVNNESTESSDIQAESVPDIDLSAVPEKHREYVDVEKYQSDEDYKRAIEHGWKPREAFEAEGLDDADWTGYRQFNRRYDDRQSLKSIKEGQDALVRTLEKQKLEAARQAVEQERARMQEELKLAASDGDVNKALEIQQRLIETEQQASNIPDDSEEPEIVVMVRQKHPFLDAKSDQFDPEVNVEFERLCGKLAKEEHEAINFGIKDPRQMRKLTNLQVKTILNEAIEMVKDKVKTKQVNSQQKPPSVSKPSQRTNNSIDYKNSLPKQWQDTYNRLLVAKGGGKEAADAFAKEVMEGVK